MDTDYLMACIVADSSTDIGGLHGVEHWRNVERTGILLASHTPEANVDIVQLFALFHDCQRVSDGDDPGHGERAAEFAASLRDQKVFELSDEHFEKLAFACRHHADGKLTSDSTIGVGWDSDRLDLGRVGIQPKAEYMSTAIGQEMAYSGSKTLFTIDTKGTFRPGSVIEPAPDSTAGLGLLMAPALWKIQKGYSSDEQTLVETALELVRRARFPHYPCRQQVFFACSSLAELERLNDQCNRKRGFHGDIYEIEGKSHGPFDTLSAFTKWSDDLEQRARCYWKQLETPKPLHEYLVTLPAKIGRQVGII